MKSRYNPLSWILLILVYCYRIITKPFPSRCRFHPTCSQYALDAIRQFGPIKSSFLIIKRIGKCHPFHPGGIDYIEVERESSESDGDQKIL
jgi:putative membrane protein insertion efficiency factor